MKDLGKVSGRDFILLFVSHELYKMGTPPHQPLYPFLPDHSYEMVFNLPLLAILFLTLQQRYYHVSLYLPHPDTWFSRVESLQLKQLLTQASRR